MYQDKQTVADPFAFIMAGWPEDMPKSWKDYPNIKRFMGKMNEGEAIQKVFEESSS